MASSSPRDEKAIAVAPPPCATSEAISLPLSASHNLTKPSCPQLAMDLPSGDQATAFTRPVCAAIVARSFFARPWK